MKLLVNKLKKNSQLLTIETLNIKQAVKDENYNYRLNTIKHDLLLCLELLRNFLLNSAEAKVTI